MKFIKLTNYDDGGFFYINAETIKTFLRDTREDLTIIYYGIDHCSYVKETEEEILELINTNTQ